MKKIRYFLEYAFVRLLESLIRTFPRQLSFQVGERLGLLLKVFIPKRHKLILDNLTHAFPELTSQRKQVIARAVWKNIGRTAAEFVRLGEINRLNYRDFIVYEGLDNATRALAKGKGLVLVGFHFSNWEINAPASSFGLGNVTAIARPIKNPFMEKWVQSKRAASEARIILHRQAVKESLKCLKEKGALGILVDQNLYTGGVFVDFFGRPAATTTLPALLHIRTGVPVLLVYSLREGPLFRTVYEPEIVFPSVKDPNQRILAYTEIITKHLENVIRRYPENWFWIHNRWKRKPE